MKFYIETYGCQMNVADSELISSIMINNGFEPASSIEDTNILLFNTCSIRQHAEDRVLGRISNEMSRKLTNNEFYIGVVGCMAQRLEESLFKRKLKIDFVVGVDQYNQIPSIINTISSNKKTVLQTEMDSQEIYKETYPYRAGHLNAFVTIMRGCNNFCSYCIVPYVRGRERSRASEEIIKEVIEAGEKGFKDVTLLGQNVNSYDWHNLRFPDLLRELNKINTIHRLRFVTSHPKDLSDDLIEAMATSEKVCEHVHLPVQSGDNEVLRTMNRGYTAEHYIQLIDKLRKAIPDIAITTDIIVGFPGETDEQFQHTIDLMNRVQFDFAFMFKYSPREGTKAAAFTNQVEESIRLQRLQEVIDLQSKITTTRYQEQIGKIKEIYVEDVSKKSSIELSGKSRDFKITVFEGDPSLIGKFVNVKITDAAGWTLRGQLLED